MMGRKSLGGVVGIRKAERQLSLTDNLCAVPEMFPFLPFPSRAGDVVGYVAGVTLCGGDLDDFFMWVIGGPW